MGRVERLQAVMAGAGVGMALFSVGPDLRYLTGYQAKASERMTMLGVPLAGDPWLVVPRLEAPLVPDGVADLVIWDEEDDPAALVAARCGSEESIAVGDHTWSVFLVRLMDKLDRVRWSVGSELTRRLRVLKDETELEALSAAAAAVDRVLARVPDEVGFTGKTEAEVSAHLRRLTIEEGHQTAEFAIVASGPNGASPHHSPGNRVMVLGDTVVCDFGGSWAGYQSDVTRTLAVGVVDPLAVEVHAVVSAANRAGREAVRPGVACEEVDEAARAVIDAAGFGDRFIHRTGHGIGLEVHEQPYLVRGNKEPLEPGMTFSVEPGVYIPGRLGVRIEDIVVCGDDGVEELNNASRDLVVVS